MPNAFFFYLQLLVYDCFPVLVFCALRYCSRALSTDALPAVGYSHLLNSLAVKLCLTLRHSALCVYPLTSFFYYFFLFRFSFFQFSPSQPQVSPLSSLLFLQVAFLDFHYCHRPRKQPQN